MSERTEVGVALVIIFWGLCWGEPDLIDAAAAKLADVPLATYIEMRQ